MDTDPFKTRWTLIERLGDPADAEAWNAFVRIYVGLIRSQARTLGLAGQDIDDVIQEVLIVVRNKTAGGGFSRDGGKFRNWLYSTTRFTAENVKRKNKRLPTRTAELLEGVAGRVVGGRAIVGDPAAEIEEVLTKEWQRQIFIEALSQVRNTVSEKAWQAYEMTHRTTVTGPDSELIHEWHRRAVPGSVEKAAKAIGWTSGRVTSEAHKVFLKIESLCRWLMGNDDQSEAAA